MTSAPPLHALNASFDWRDHRGPFRVLTPEQVRHYDELGYFVLEGALAPAEVDELVAAIDPFEAKAEEALRGREGGRFFIARADEITAAVAPLVNFEGFDFALAPKALEQMAVSVLTLPEYINRAADSVQP